MRSCKTFSGIPNDFSCNRSLIAALPYNTMYLYSVSKNFGATGWRIAVISIFQKNIFNHFISEVPENKTKILGKQYKSLTNNVAKLKFINRMVADSRQVAHNNIAVLSIPQQMQMGLFAASSIHDYKKRMSEIIRNRLNELSDNCGIKLEVGKNRAEYYSKIELLI